MKYLLGKRFGYLGERTPISRAVALSFAFALSLVGFGQAPTPALPVTPVAAPSGWDTPQNAVLTFVHDMRLTNLPDARKAMDLSDVPFPVRNELGNQYAQYLISILSRIPKFHPEELPTAPKQSTVTIPVKMINGRLAGDLVLQKDASDAWAFDSSTVSNLPKIFDLVQFQSQDNEIGQFAEPPSDPSMEIRAYIPSVLLHSFLWMELWQWAGLGLLLVAAMLLALLVRIAVRVSLKLFFKRWLAILSPASAKSLRRSLGLLAGALLWVSVFPYLGLSKQETITLILVVLITAFRIGAWAWLVDACFDVAMDSLSARASALVRRADQILIPIAKKFFRFLIFLGAILAFASSMSFNVNGLVAGLGIGGLIVALAGKDSVENIFGSLTIIFDMPFGIGDYIKLANGEGTVEEINLRSTRIRTSADTLVTIPNSNLITASVENFGARRFRRTQFVLPLSYANEVQNIRRFCDAAREILTQYKSINQEMSHVDLDSASDSFLSVAVRAYFTSSNYSEELELRESLISDLIKAAADAKVILGPVIWGGINAPESLLPANPVQDTADPK